MSGVSLRRVNHDSSWLFSFPTEAIFPTSTFNLLIDPWLDESEQVDYHSAFSEQKRTLPALTSSIAGLEELLASEANASDKATSEGRKSSQNIDAILVSHPFTDHMHPGTLRESSMPSRIPFLVTSDAKVALEGLLGGRKKLYNENRRILMLKQAGYNTAPAFPDEQGTRILPRNVEILQILPRERFSILSGAASMAWSKLHGGILFLWKPPSAVHSTPTAMHSMIYSPHGIGPKSIPRWLSSNSDYQHEAILTSLDKIVLPNWLSGVVNLGLSSAIDLVAQDLYNSKRLLATHEERKEAKGLVAHPIKRYFLGLETPDARNDGLTELKQRDSRRQVEAQEIVDAALKPSKSCQVLVLDINEPLII